MRWARRGRANKPTLLGRIPFHRCSLRTLRTLAKRLDNSPLQTRRSDDGDYSLTLRLTRGYKSHGSRYRVSPDTVTTPNHVHSENRLPAFFCRSRQTWTRPSLFARPWWRGRSWVFSWSICLTRSTPPNACGVNLFDTFHATKCLWRGGIRSVA
jgi:hypothetical protein